MRVVSAFLACVLWLQPSVRAEQRQTLIEQDVVREKVDIQPAMHGKQRIWFTDKHIRNEIAYDEHVNVAILDLQADRIVLITGKEPQYIQLSLDDYRSLVAMRLAASGLNDDDAQPRLQKTEKTKQIGDWLCTRYLFEQGGRLPVKSELWVAADTGVDFAAWLGLMDAMGLTRTLGRIGGFAGRIEGIPIKVRTEQTIFDQTLVTTTRIRKITIGPVDPTLFQVPAGYERIEAEPLPGREEKDPTEEKEARPENKGG